MSSSHCGDRPRRTWAPAPDGLNPPSSRPWANASESPMFITNLLTITPWPTLSAAILLVLLIMALYLARHTAHQAIHAVTSALARGFRLASHSVAHAEERLAARNREVLLAAGRDAKERMVEREFVRVADTARKDLGGSE